MPAVSHETGLDQLMIGHSDMPMLLPKTSRAVYERAGSSTGEVGAVVL